MKILVTGGAGYVGSVLVPLLLARDHNVTVLDNFMFGQTSLNQHCNDPHFNVVKGDCRDETVLRPLLADADLLIPLAALVGAPLCDRDIVGALSTNVGAIRTAIELMSREQQIIIPITNSGYGIGEKGKECTEDSPLRPISLYGRTKVEAEKLVLDRCGISLRLATVFGMSPRMRLDLLVNDFVFRAVTDRALVVFEGHFKRNYLHVKDVARAFCYAMEHYDLMRAMGKFNVGLSDANLSKLELCEKIKTHIPEFTYIEAPIGKDPDQRDYIVSNARIEKHGLKPMYSLDHGILELLKGYKMLSNTRHGNV